MEELERLQQILLYRELDFTLEQIKEVLDGAAARLPALVRQEELLLLRKQRLEAILATLQKTIASAKKGVPMNDKELFEGFESAKEWEEAMKEQQAYLQETYGFDMLEATPIDVQSMNEQAAEAAAFITGMTDSLKAGVKHYDERVVQRIGSHLAFLNAHGHSASAADFAAQTRFFLEDDFHLRMLENQQAGLAYYLAAAAASYAAAAQ